MRFRDRSQQSRACRALLSTVRLEHLWTFEGPTPAAFELRRAIGMHLTAAEAAVFRAAFDFWDTSGACTFGLMLTVLDREQLAVIWSLVMAVDDPLHAHAAIDRWLVRHERRSLFAVRREP